MSVTGYDFSGWATKNNLRCADGRIINQDAFSIQDGRRVPLVWNHQHNTPENTLGHAILENKDEGVYAYCFFNNTPSAEHAKSCVAHGDVTALSIYAKNLEHSGNHVVHGTIIEVSLVHSGANPGAFIESVLAHNMPMDDDDEEGIFYTGENIFLSHANNGEEKVSKKEDPEPEKNEKPKKSDDEKTVKDVYETMNDDQKKATAYLVQEAIKEATKVVSENNEEKDNKKKGDSEMKHNVFDKDDQNDMTDVLMHSLTEVLEDAKKNGSLREAIRSRKETDDVLAHALDTTGMTKAVGNQSYGFNDPDMLFPEFRNVNGNAPEWLSRNMDWVNKLMAAVHRTPFSRVKSVYANITEDEARARGYIKGKQKKEEVFTTLKRSTSAQTVYKLQKMDRDDIIEITDFDVVAWLRSEMRLMLNEEIARAILIGDGRPTDSDDHISEEHIRPIVKDVPLYNITKKIVVDSGATEEEIAKATIKEIIRSRKEYKGSGNPIFWATEEAITEMLLLEDGIGHRLYKTEAELATALRVKEIVPVEPMEGYELEIESKKYPLIGTIVNLADYNVGADRGGEINNFDDFDIDFNQHKYLIETRISGALIKPFSALTYVLDNGISTMSLAAKTSSKVTVEK